MLDILLKLRKVRKEGTSTVNLIPCGFRILNLCCSLLDHCFLQITGESEEAAIKQKNLFGKCESCLPK